VLNVLANIQPKNAKKWKTKIQNGEGHPANYRGYIVAKELQKIKNKNYEGETS